jgi:hypothetical protein
VLALAAGRLIGMFKFIIGVNKGIEGQNLIHGIEN